MIDHGSPECIVMMTFATAVMSSLLLSWVFRRQLAEEARRRASKRSIATPRMIQAGAEALIYSERPDVTPSETALAVFVAMSSCAERD